MYPRTVKLFKPWAHAMVEGATVDKPNYGKKMGLMRRRKKSRRRRRSRGIRKRLLNA